MPKIDLMIVGAQKAGTTSLKNYLAEHPEITSHVQTEFTYFLQEAELKTGFDEIFKSQFEIKKTYQKIIAKNVAMAQNEAGLQALKTHNPDCKIVYILREPVSRAYSSYTMAVKDGWMKRPFDDIIEVLNKKDYNDQMYRFFIEQGVYVKYIRSILKFFPVENIKYVRFEDLKEKPKYICCQIFDWLKINPDFTPQLEIKHNATTKVKSQTILKLTNYLRNENNPIKKIIKTVLPYKTFNKLGEGLRGINTSEKKFENISKESAETLQRYFFDINQELESLTGIKY